jgi:predicted RNA-binding Zn ribbon-like protein
MTSRVWLLPEEPLPVRLMNTVWADRHGVYDSLDSAAALVEWLVVTGLAAPTTRVTRAGLTSARRLRDALRRLAAEATGDDRAAAASPLTASTALAEINALILTTHVPPALVCEGDGFAMSQASAGGVLPVALATVALHSLPLLVGPSPLRACPAPGCVLYFVQDHPRRAWCSDGCGNRVRAARHYARSRERG